MKPFAKYRHYEYWPFWLFYLPTLPYWLVLAIRARHPLYMTAANPGIEMGGFFGESKSGILNLVPHRYKPQTQLLLAGQIPAAHDLENWGLQFPLIAKPNIGERGDGVALLDDMQSLQHFLTAQNQDYLLQEYSSYRYEYGVLYYRIPGQEKGRVISITGKRFMQVVGDGQRSLRELMQAELRFAMQIERMENSLDLNRIPSAGEKVLLEPIGNHCRGTEFTNENALISDAVHAQFDAIAKAMPGFYIGRFDLKAGSPKDLETGERLHILEVNGTTSEAGHIYDRDYTIWRAYRDIYKLMTAVYQVSVAAHKQGQPYTKAGEFIRTVLAHFRGERKNLAPPKTNLILSTP